MEPAVPSVTTVLAPTHVPRTEKQPPAISTPPVPEKVEVADLKFATALMEKREDGEEVPTPTLPTESTIN